MALKLTASRVNGILAWTTASVLAAALSSAGLFAQDEAPVEYDIRQGSFIRDDCWDCDRIPIQRPLEGSFILTARPPMIGGQTFDVTSFDAASPEGDYLVKGSGTYSQIVTMEPLQEMVLDIEVNGVSGIQLRGGPNVRTAPEPAIDIEVREPGDRDPNHVVTIRIVAAPRVKGVLYELSEESYFVDDCEICGRPSILIPISGTFLLGEIAGSPNPTSTYRVDAIDFQGLDPHQDIVISGAGIYQQGGEVAIAQFMKLEIDVSSGGARVLESTDPAVPVTFPAVDIQIKETKPDSQTSVYSLRIVAKPAEDPPQPRFRRGDTNADGKVDISDPVSLLQWKFVGGSTPTCLEAADSNGDGAPDLSDAVHTLVHLFQGGPAPPAPGPSECGVAPNPVLGCESYPDC
jgi:hypothetical protein